MISSWLNLFAFLAASVLLTFVGTLRAEDAAKSGRVLSLDELFALLDKNHDGKISKDEATGVYAQRFSQWDADGDGFATRQEIHDYRLRMGIDDAGQRIPNGRPGAAGGTRRTTASAVLLNEPADWRLENIPMPPGFAPDVKLTGTEEIRFAPGMFDTNSSTYFTCAIAITANGVSELGAADIKDFLEKYYTGLSTAVGQGKGLKPDPSQMKATVDPAPPGPDAKNRFLAQINFFDSFSDGRKITLHVEAVVVPRPEKKQTCMILLVSPSAQESDVWPTLREIGKKAETNAH